MPSWPFGRLVSSVEKPTSQNKSQAEQELLGHPDSKSSKDSIAGLEWRRFKDPRNLLTVIVLTSTFIGFYSFYRSRLRRIPQAKDLPQSAWRKRTLKGVVTRVGDGDGFHLYHTPGGWLAGWGWMRHVPAESKQLKDQTIHVRLAGVDAPEVAHFGRPGQPGGQEALDWLMDYLLHRSVKIKPHKRDQYDRAVSTAFIWKYLLRRDVGLQMLKTGLATVYEAKSGAEYGGREEMYRRVEGRAKSRGRGMWASKGMWPWRGKVSDVESPMEFKRKQKELEEGQSWPPKHVSK